MWSTRVIVLYIVASRTKSDRQMSMANRIPGNSVGAAHTIQTAPPASVRDSLFLPTNKELKTVHYRIAAESREARERVGGEFRTSQPGIYAYLPYGPSTLRALAYEHALLLSYARHVYAAMESRYGKLPVLRADDLQATEARAKTLLAHRPTAKKVEKLGAVQFALGGILGVHYFDGIKVVPDPNHVLLKVLTLLMCFSDAITDRQQRSGTDQQAPSNAVIFTISGEHKQ